MNKKIIVFICILSFLVPFIPHFDFVVRADNLPSTSEDYAQWIEDNFYESNGILMPKTLAPLYMKINWALTDAGYVLKDPVSCVVDSLQSATNLQLLTKQNLMDYGQTINYDYSSLSQNIVNNSFSYVENLTPYNIYTVLHKSDLLSLFSPHNSEVTKWLSNLNIDFQDSNFVYWFGWDSGMLSSGADNNGFQIMKVPLSFFNNYCMYFNQDIPDNFFNADNFFFNHSALTPNFDADKMFSLWCASSNSAGTIPNSLTFSNGFYDGTLTGIILRDSSYDWNLSGSFNIRTNNVNGVFTLPSYYYFQDNWLYGQFYSLMGSFFIVPDSVDKFSFMIFRDYQSLYDFYNGQCSVYKFDSNLNIPEGADIDYSRLYDIISNQISHSTGNLTDVINGLATDYLQQQIDLLHDINNALNDGTGQSWLRRIYGLLDYNFPLTLQAFEDLQQAIQNISLSGGGSDLTHINRVLDEINDKLGFMIEEPLTNADIEDMNDLKNLASQKFPFCVFSDIVAISVILNQTPEQPHWQIPLKLPGSESVNNIEVDLSWYEDVRDLVQGVFIFIFIVGLLALSVKVFSALKS